MNATSFLREDIYWAHELFDMVTADVTQKQTDWQPSGVANPLGAIYAHAVCAEDALINALLKGGATLYASSWEGKTGVSVPQFHVSPEWARSVKVDLTHVQQYKQAVFEATNDYVATLKDADLDREMDLTRQGFDHKTVGWIIAALLISHLNNMIGEISCLKGLQDAKGYPF